MAEEVGGGDLLFVVCWGVRMCLLSRSRNIEKSIESIQFSTHTRMHTREYTSLSPTTPLINTHTHVLTHLQQPRTPLQQRPQVIVHQARLVLRRVDDIWDCHVFVCVCVCEEMCAHTTEGGEEGGMM